MSGRDPDGPCARCGEPRYVTSTGYISGYCYRCHVANVMRWRRDNPERIKEIQSLASARWLASKTPAERSAMWRRRNHKQYVPRPPRVLSQHPAAVASRVYYAAQKAKREAASL